MQSATADYVVIWKPARCVFFDDKTLRLLLSDEFLVELETTGCIFVSSFLESSNVVGACAGMTLTSVTCRMSAVAQVTSVETSTRGTEGLARFEKSVMKLFIRFIQLSHLTY